MCIRDSQDPVPAKAPPSPSGLRVPDVSGTGHRSCRTRSLRRIPALAGQLSKSLDNPCSPGRPRVHEAQADVLEQHGQSLGLADDGQEVRVAAPPRDNMLVQVGAHSCTGNSTLVDPDVVAHRRGRGFQRSDARLGQNPELKGLIVGQVDVKRYMTVGADQHVTGVVREKIHHDVAALATVDDQTFGVSLTYDRTEGAALTGMIGRAFAVDVNHPVRRPETLEAVVDERELLLRLQRRPLAVLLLRHGCLLYTS